MQSTLSVDFESAQNLINSVANLIYQRFEFHRKNEYQFFTGAANIGEMAWDIMKYKFALKMLASNSTFLMTFGGSSVTAGHDNYFHQSFPMIFEKRMKPIFDALGTNFVSDIIYKAERVLLLYILIC